MGVADHERRSSVLAGIIFVATAWLFAGCAGATAGADPAETASLPSGPRASATPESDPAQVVKQEEVREAVPFTSSTVDDPNLDVGTSAVVSVGRNGERVITYEVVYEDGSEIERRLISDVVSVPPVAEVTAVGTRVPPPPPPPQPVAAGECDPNYSSPCVPIASDVDCAGGSGNGPAYVAGPVYVVGTDIYDLDRDGDGIACD